MLKFSRYQMNNKWRNKFHFIPSGSGLVELHFHSHNSAFLFHLKAQAWLIPSKSLDSVNIYITAIFLLLFFQISVISVIACYWTLVWYWKLKGLKMMLHFVQPSKLKTKKVFLGKLPFLVSFDMRWSHEFV